MSNTTTPAELAQIFFSYTFHFTPGMAASIIPLVGFAIMGLVSLILNVMHARNFKTMYIVTFSGFWEVIGYTARLYISMNTDQKQSIMPYMIYVFFVLLTPIFLALVNYRAVGVVLRIINKPVSLGIFKLQPHQITKFFFTSDCITLMIQGGGGGMLAIQNDTLNKMGLAIASTGIAIQLIFFAALVWIIISVRTNSDFWTPLTEKLPTAKYLFAGLCWTISMLFVRNVYRLVEFCISSGTFILPYLEWTFFVFESLVILSAFVGYSVFHFGRLFEAQAIEDAEKPRLELEQTA